MKKLLSITRLLFVYFSYNLVAIAMESLVIFLVYLAFYYQSNIYLQVLSIINLLLSALFVKVVVLQFITDLHWFKCDLMKLK